MLLHTGMGRKLNVQFLLSPAYKDDIMYVDKKKIS